MHHDHSSSEAETPATGQQPFVLQVASVKGRGGITTAVGHYARMFERNGVATAVVFRGPAANELRAQGIDVIDAPRLLLSPIAVAFPLQRLRAEVAKRAGGSRLIVLAHSDRALPALRRIFPRAFFITPCHSDKFHHKRGADLVITLNPAQSALARVALPHARIRELGNPYAPLETRPTPTEHASPSEGMPVRFNFLGRLEGFKDPGTLIRAFAIAALDPRTTLRIIGAGPLLHELQHEAQPLGARVEFAGWKAGPFASFGPADVLVLPSTWESYSYVIREALDHGAPIIASDIGVHRDALGDGAFGELFPAGDAQALARRLEQAQTGLESMRARAAQGRRALLERYGAAAFWNAFRAAVEVT